MNIDLFKLALKLLQHSDWDHFERLCSQFLVTEFDNLRTMAHPSGDGGRDSEIFTPDSLPTIAAQYSVASDWRAKIRQTARRISENFPGVSILVYMSNHQIGGQADDLRKELLKQKLSLDIRDQNWFIERASTDSIRENAARELIDRIARPYLAGEGVIDKPTSPLTSGEAKAALVYLGLQWQDDVTEKGLTKLSFDALVRSALRHTHSSRRLSREQIHKAISVALTSAEPASLTPHIDRALKRLTKRFIRHHTKEDEFCLTNEEQKRILARLAEKENEESDFRETVKCHCSNCLEEIESATEKDIEDLIERVPRVLEKLLLRQGEIFVCAVLSNSLDRVGSEQLKDIILQDITAHPPESEIKHQYLKLIATSVQSILGQPDASTHIYLRRLANSYTLLSFLNQTPDVQSATRKLFSHGTIWVDTTVLLPIIAEQLEEDEARRRLTKMFVTCNNSGIELRVTSGVLQEINTHMNKALSCARCSPSEWRGRIPYLYYQFLNSGQPPADFSKWLSLFRGTERPEDDLAQFLNDIFGMRRENLGEYAMQVDNELRFAADRLWTSAHKNRRRDVQQIDDATTRQLIQHDIETYLGVIALRQKEDVTELGYRHWLLTLDSNAWKIRDLLKDEFRRNTPPSPLLSLSFLLNSMTFGPGRNYVGKINELKLPFILDVEMSESLPHDIIKTADQVRRDNEGLPEYVIRRKVRDAIDKARRRRGVIGPSNLFDNEVAE